jgi:zinc/manganese transport system permease protein
MNMTEILILLPALAAGLLVLSTHVPLGINVLRRGIIFIDLAIAQIAGLGALAAQLLLERHDHAPESLIQLFSLGAALTGAMLLTWMEKKFPDIQEALIGCLFVLVASLALLLVGQDPHGGEHMKDLLAGQILWVSWQQIGWTTILYAVILAVWFGKHEKLGRFGFYALFACAITASVQLVGVYLVFASLILPAIASRHAQHRLSTAYAIGAAGIVSGIALSGLFDLITGPAVVCTMTAATVIMMLCSGGKKC